MSSSVSSSSTKSSSKTSSTRSSTSSLLLMTPQQKSPYHHYHQRNPHATSIPPAAAFQSLPLMKTSRRSSNNNNNNNDIGGVAGSGGSGGTGGGSNTGATGRLTAASAAKTPIDPTKGFQMAAAPISPTRSKRGGTSPPRLKTNPTNTLTVKDMSNRNIDSKQTVHALSSSKCNTLVDTKRDLNLAQEQQEQQKDAKSSSSGRLFDQLLLLNNDSQQGPLQQACLSAFCGILEGKNPPRAVVDGLWSKVVLPQMTEKLPELVAQEMWQCLGRKLQFLKQHSTTTGEGPTSGGGTSLFYNHGCTNIVKISHHVYLEFGKTLLFQERWRMDFGLYLQNSLLLGTNGAGGNYDDGGDHGGGDVNREETLNSSQQQPNIRDVQIYAVQNLCSYWLELDKVEWAGRLLHQPSVLKRQWELLSTFQTPLEMTIHQCHQIEQYLASLKEKATKNANNNHHHHYWQEALGLYQGWHTMLQLELESKLGDDLSSTSGSSRSTLSSTSKSISRKRLLGREKKKDHHIHGLLDSPAGSRRRHHRHHLSSSSKRQGRVSSSASLPPPPVDWILLMGRSLYTLAMSLDTILTEMPTENPALAVLWKRQADYFQESLHVYAILPHHDSIQYMMSSATWLAYAQTCATLEECDMHQQHVADVHGLSTQLYDNMEHVTPANNLAEQMDSHHKDNNNTATSTAALESSSCEVQCYHVVHELLERSKQETVARHGGGGPRHMQLVWLSLKAELSDQYGRWLYNQRLYSSARGPLEQATKLKRRVLGLLKDHQSPTSTSSIFQWWTSTLQATATAAANTMSNNNNSNNNNNNAKENNNPPIILVPEQQQQQQQMLQDSKTLVKSLLLASEKIPDMEMSLSSSLEYAALALHACDMSMAALSWLQESLILKTTHVGNMSSEVARLHLAMAVVHEDLLQWEAALSRYRECLRIRMHLLSGQQEQQQQQQDFDGNNDILFSMVHNAELFHSILETLRSMGNAYRMMGDHDNAVGCFWKIATMSRKEWEYLNRSTQNGCLFWGFDSHSENMMMQNQPKIQRTTPLPTLVLDEERYSTSNQKGSSSSKSLVAAVQEATTVEPCEGENEILFEAAQAYQAIISLFKDKSSANNKQQSSMSSSASSSSSNLANLVGLEDVPLLLASSYHLGMIHIHFGDFRSAIVSLEHALHSVWILDPSSSEESGSDSAYSSEDEDDDDDVGDDDKHLHKRSSKWSDARIKSRNRTLRGIFGKEMEAVDDEGVYHALGICRAACGEHDQAVRFHLTALRCARRMYGVNSVRASEILYDAATSYWHLKEYDKAGEFWSASLQIRYLQVDKQKQKQQEQQQRSDDNDKQNGKNKNGIDFEYAKTLYNTAASLCAMGRYSDPRTLKSLEEAKQIFSRPLDKTPRVEVANCLFYMAATYYRRATLSETMFLKTASVHLNRASSIYRTLGYLSSSPGATSNNSTAISGQQKHGALQAHIRFLEANISEALGKLHLAMDTYVVALHLYRNLKQEEEGWRVYVASVLHTMGKLSVKMSHDAAALEQFEEAWFLRRQCLGRDHEAVGDTLFHLANVYARMDNDDACCASSAKGRQQNHAIVAMEMYHEALRIQLESDGSDSPAVAQTLLMIASLYAKQGLYELAMQKLKASLAIRKKRADRVGRASRVASFWSGDLADDYLFISNKRDEQQEQEQEQQPKQPNMSSNVGEPIVTPGDGTTNSGNHVVRKALMDDMTREENELAVVLHYMGNIHVMMYEYHFAKECYEQSLRVRRRHAVTDFMSSPEGGNEKSNKLHVADTLHNLGCLYELMKDYNNALKYFATALKLKHRMCAMTNDLPQTKDSLIKKQIVIYEGKGSLDGSKYLVQGGSLSYAATLHRIGTIHHRLGNRDVAIACFESALRIQKHYLGRHHFKIAQTYADMGSVLRQMQGRQQDALKVYKKVHDIRTFRSSLVGKQQLEGSFPNVGHILYQMGALHDRDKDYNRAMACYHEAIKVYGRRYILSMGRKLCQAILFQTNNNNNSSRTGTSLLLDHANGTSNNEGWADAFFKTTTARTTCATSAEGMINPCQFAKNKNLGNNDVFEQDIATFDLFSNQGVHVKSIEETDDMIRAHVFSTVAKALRQAASRNSNNVGGRNNDRDSTLMLDLDLGAPDCWISLELYLLSLYELWSCLTHEWRGNVAATMEYVLRRLEEAGAEGALMKPDQVTYNMLYLIQE